MMRPLGRSNPAGKLPWIVALAAVLLISSCTNAQAKEPVQEDPFRPLITKEERRLLVVTDEGSVWAANVSDGCGRSPYQVQFITMEPGSVFLPVLLHTDMVFFVQSGNGSVSWWAGYECKKKSRKATRVAVEAGDVYRLPAGSVFYVESAPASDRRLRIHALFDASSAAEKEEEEVPIGRPYSNLTDIVRGFDREVLQMGFKVSEEVIQTLKGAETTPPIVPNAQGQPNDTEAASSRDNIDLSPANEDRNSRSFRIMNRMMMLMKATDSSNSDNSRRKKTDDAVDSKMKKKKNSPYNVLKEKPDFENTHGSGTIVTNEDLHALKGSRIGVFVLNLKEGSMLSPHWNPSACQIAIVTHGQAMVQLVRPAAGVESSSQNGTGTATSTTRLRAEEGDVIVVPRHHGAAHMSYTNSTFCVVGFTTGTAAAAHKHKIKGLLPQFLTGSWSVLRAFDRDVLALSFNVPNSTIDQLLSTADDNDVFTGCASCAEEEEKRMMQQSEEGFGTIRY